MAASALGTPPEFRVVCEREGGAGRLTEQRVEFRARGGDFAARAGDLVVHRREREFRLHHFDLGRVAGFEPRLGGVAHPHGETAQILREDQPPLGGHRREIGAAHFRAHDSDDLVDGRFAGRRHGLGEIHAGTGACRRARWGTTPVTDCFGVSFAIS